MTPRKPEPAAKTAARLAVREARRQAKGYDRLAAEATDDAERAFYEQEAEKARDRAGEAQDILDLWGKPPTRIIWGTGYIGQSEEQHDPH